MSHTVKFIIGTILSIIGMVLTCLSFQIKNKKWMLFAQTAGSVFFCVSYPFLGADFAMIINIAILLRNLTYLLIDSKKEPKKALAASFFLLGLYVLAYVIYTVLVRPPLMNCLFNLLLVPGVYFGTLAFAQSEPLKIRFFKMPECVCWLIFNTSCLSIGGIICEVFNLISNTISIFRFREKKPDKAIAAENGDNPIPSDEASLPDDAALSDNAALSDGADTANVSE